MRTLRIIAATLAAALCALGLTVGAAMAAGDHAPAKARTAKSAPKERVDVVVP